MDTVSQLSTSLSSSADFSALTPLHDEPSSSAGYPYASPDFAEVSSELDTSDTLFSAPSAPATPGFADSLFSSDLKPMTTIPQPQFYPTAGSTSNGGGLVSGPGLSFGFSAPPGSVLATASSSGSGLSEPIIVGGGPDTKKRKHDLTGGVLGVQVVSEVNGITIKPEPAETYLPTTIFPHAAEMGSTGGPANAQAQQQLNKLHQVTLQTKEALEKMRSMQRPLMQRPEMQAFKVLDVEQKALKTKLEAGLALLQHVNRSYSLEPPELHKHSFLKQELEVQLQQLDLYMRELQLLLQPPAPRVYAAIFCAALPNFSSSIAALAIIKQPFPLVITKSKQLSEQNMQVKLLTGASMDPVSCSPVKASMVRLQIRARFSPSNSFKIIDTHQVKDAVDKALGCCTQPLDPVTQVAQFPLKFQMGTRKNSVTIKFSMQLKVGQGDSAATATIESESSRHFVVITNEIQWQGSAGTLLKRDAFEGQVRTRVIDAHCRSDVPL
jgi:hypothetical protein